MTFLWVFLGGGLGSMARYGMSVLTATMFGIQFLLGTLVVNTLGSFMMGLIVEYFAAKGGLPEQGKLFLTTGFLGGFTTFSAFSMEVVLLHSKGGLLQAASYTLASVFLGVSSLYAGMLFIRFTA